MLRGWWVTVLLLPALTQAQSGDEGADTEPRVSCISHIMTAECSLTCELVGNYDGDDEDDEEGDDIESMKICYTDWVRRMQKCLDSYGRTIKSNYLNPLTQFTLTVLTKRGRRLTTSVDLKTIVKPRSPHVRNVTFNLQSNEAVFYIGIPYHKDLLKVQNQLFQLHIWTAGSETTQNISSLDTLRINMDHLQSNRTYQVAVRAIPLDYIRGSWSEWSPPCSFSTPADETSVLHQEPDIHWEVIYKLIMFSVPLVVTFSLIFFWKNKIFTYMWPNIPHPKHTLVQICKPNKGLLLHIKPEVFSALKVSPMESTGSEETEPSLPAAAAAAAAPGSDAPSSTQSSDCSSCNASASTEELELLSRSSSDGEDSLRSSGPSSVDFPWPAEKEPEVFAGNQQEEAYVTMSSFYQIT